MKIPITKPFMGEEERKVCFNAISSGWISQGVKVKEFENLISKYVNAKYGIATSSCTTSLHISLLSMGIKQGDEIIVPSFTFIATANSVLYTGAKPVFVDIDEKTYNIDPSKLEEKITKETKAIIPVHLYGQPADMEEINQIADKYNLIVIEDACQAHNSEYKNKKIPISETGCFSFYPGKNLGAYGEGGIIVTDNKEIAEKTRLLRDHGQREKYVHDIIGFNSRMEGIQGAILNVKLKHLDKWTEKRRDKAKVYNELLYGVVETPIEKNDRKHVYHLYVTRTRNRERLIEFLKKRGISTSLHYPIPIHLQKAFSYLNYAKGSFPITEKYADEILSLPIYPELNEEQIKYVCDSIKEFYKI